MAVIMIYNERKITSPVYQNKKIFSTLFIWRSTKQCGFKCWYHCSFGLLHSSYNFPNFKDFKVESDKFYFL